MFIFFYIRKSEGGINHNVVSDVELEPEVQVGVLGSVSGVPRGWTAQQHCFQSPCVISYRLKLPRE